MKLNEEEMETILVMFEIAEAEGQESDTMYFLVRRIKEEIIREKLRRAKW